MIPFCGYYGASINTEFCCHLFPLVPPSPRQNLVEKSLLEGKKCVLISAVEIVVQFL